MGGSAAKRRIVYQIYPKSFYDSDQDGIGDLKGITAKLDYLKALGVNTLWLNPIYVSPQIDNGYDVSDYYQLDPTFGTWDDFAELVKQVHAKGMELILDLVLNHTSDQHPWFKEALKDKQSKYRDYYIWQEAPAGKLPNNWGSFFGGSVWQADPTTKNNYYFHLFAKEMPDLNWKNPAVREEMYQVAKFWLAQGIDGFRLDAFIHIAKADLAQNVLTDSDSPQIAEMFYANLPAVKTYLAEFIGRLRQEKPDIFILGEAASADIDLAVTYTTPEKKACDTVVTFRYFTDDESYLDQELPRIGQLLPLDLKAFRTNMLEWQKRLEGVSYPTLYWSNHDLPRIVTRFAPKKAPEKAAKMLATLMYLQRGIPCIYYGEELGMRSAFLPDLASFEDEQIIDFATKAQAKGKTPEEILKMASQAHKMAARTPLRWDDSDFGGFSSVLPWKWGQETSASIKAQMADEKSVLSFYQQVLALKQTDLFIDGRFILENTEPELYVYRRILAGKEALVLCNLSEHPQTVALSAPGKVCLSSNAKVHEKSVTLKEYGCLVLMREGV